jgi:beta-glucosidase
LKPEQVAQIVNDIQSFLIQHTRLGIPAMVHEECCSGFMARGATLFPQIIGLASTWEPELAYEMTSVIRSQMRAVGAHQGLAPVLDLARDPRWGRLEETFGEDPYLAARMGVAYVGGLQGPDLSRGVAATGKHFTAHGLPEGGLNWAPVHVAARELREAFLFPFEAAVKQAGLATIMNAYHELDGVPCAASRQLLTEILRDEWGFDGIVVSDYKVVMLIHYHQVAANEEAARLALQAGRRISCLAQIVMASRCARRLNLAD